MASEKQIAANRRNAAKSTGPQTEKGKARSRMNALRHGLASVLPGDQKAWDELDKHSLAGIDKRLRHINREVLKLTKLTYEVMEKTSPDQFERAVWRLAKLDRYAARAYTRLKRETK